MIYLLVSLKRQLDDDRPSHVFGFAMIKPMFMDEINLYISLISIKGLPFYMQSMLHVRIDLLD